MKIVSEWIRRLLRRTTLARPPRRSLEPGTEGADNPADGLKRNAQTSALSSAGRASPHPPQLDSAERGGEYGLRGRGDRPGGEGGAARTPRNATRYVETRLGVLSYTQPAPHLARNVLAMERCIEAGEFAQTDLDDALLLQLHCLVCGDLVPQLTGFRRTNVTVGDGHTPPDFFRPPVLVREYGLDLGAGQQREPLRALTSAHEPVLRFFYLDDAIWRS